MSLNFIKISLLSFCLALIGTSCEKTSGEPDNYVPATPETKEYVNANLVYRGAEYEDPSSWFELSLFTDMEIDEAGNPIGPGDMLRIQFNAPLFENGTTEFTLPSGTYSAAPSYYDMTEFTFAIGFDNGSYLAPGGTFIATFAEGSTKYTTEYISEGSVHVENENGIYVISGTIVGSKGKKYYFKHIGAIETIDRSNGETEQPNSTLKEDLDLTNVLTQAMVEDKGDYFFTGDESYRMFRLNLHEEGTSFIGSEPTGTGKNLKIEIFVPFASDANDGIPAGTYEISRRLPENNFAVSRADIVPFRFVEGKPDSFTYFDGSWFQGFDNNNLKQWARISSGTLTVARDGDNHVFTVNFLDSGEGGNFHRLRLNLETSSVVVYKFQPSTESLVKQPVDFSANKRTK